MDHGGGMMETNTTNGTTPVHHKMMMMHMTFFWGSHAEILFSGWPGTRPGMYVLALFFVFILAVVVEYLSHSHLIKEKNNSNHLVGGLTQTLMHAVRIGLSYLVMLAVMSFNTGIFIAVVGGHSVGFLVFGSRVFKRTEIPPYEKRTDLPPMTC
ncbi:hypothetical protein GIB67_007702 [Kingdonia uniflora]|uniref:Copper transport protein n=1 Tax=Kingdonia uniflora TaxID=39325 RepID=A0A7J7N1J3_9MAGN|nr:hypothetical protein GIB67_007702 [Kingdonia uniflora]